MKQKSELLINEPKKEPISEEHQRFFQIDLLKTIMIFLVIFDHVVYWDIKSQIAASLWERISIPIFLIIMGFNIGRSFQREGATTLKELYSWEYFKKKFWRYIMPFLTLYLVSTLTGWIMYGFDFNAMLEGQLFAHGWGIPNLFTGILPFWGPGNWFIPVIIQSIFVLPFLYWLFLKSRIFSLILCYAIEISLQMFLFTFIGIPSSYEEGYVISIMMTSILFYLSAVGLGMWFSFGHDMFDKRNLFIWILFPISLTYLILFQFYGLRLRIDGVPLLRGDYHFIVFPYSAVIFLVIMKILPNNVKGKMPRMITKISNSTYHILLTQMFAFGMMISWYGTHYIITGGLNVWDPINLIMLWGILVPIGVAWYKIDRFKNLKKRVTYSLIFFPSFVILVNGFYFVGSLT